MSTPALRVSVAQLAEAPLTFQQQWLWSLLQKYVDWKCMIAYGFRLLGPLDVPVLQRSLAEVIRRHASLRTKIVVIAGAPKQQIQDPGEEPLDCIVVVGASSAEVEENARRHFSEFSDLKIDPRVDPLLHIKLLKLNEHEHWLLLGVHRLTGDCFSIDQVLPELWSLYGNVLQGATTLAADPPQYSDYAIHQQQAHPEWVRKHDAYWQRRLAGALSLQWPIDDGAAAVPRGILGRMNGLFGETLSTGLRELARRRRALLASVVLTVFVGTLYRICRQRDFIVPCFVAGRQSEHKAVVGYFSHILFLRMELTGSETFSQLLSYASNEFFKALSHQDFGAMALNEPHLLEGTFFQWMTWHPDEGAPHVVPSAQQDMPLTIERVSLVDFAENVTAIPPGMVDVEVTFFDTPRGIYASGVYRADLFSPRTMELFIANLRAAAKDFLYNPEAQVAASS